MGKGPEREADREAAITPVRGGDGGVPGGTGGGTGAVRGEEKEAYIRDLFNGIARRYDRMNLIMTGGLWRYWQRVFSRHLQLEPGMEALDVACGTGDLSLILAARVVPGGRVEGIDLSEEMIAVGREKVARYRGGRYRDAVRLRVGNALALPFEADRFDCAVIGFALRNVADIATTLREMVRVTRPGGRILSLELSHPRHAWIAVPYHLYFDRVVPLLGRWAERTQPTRDRLAPYAWLPESLRRFPDQEGLADLFRAAGMVDVRYVNLHDGIVAIHSGVKPRGPGTERRRAAL